MQIQTLKAMGLLFLSSCVMMVAWYGHLRFKAAPLWIVVLASWGIAFFEYALQVPGNRIGHEVLTAAELRILAEAFTLFAFVGFSRFALKEPLTGNALFSLALVLVAVWFGLFGPWKAPLPY